PSLNSARLQGAPAPSLLFERGAPVFSSLFRAWILQPRRPSSAAPDRGCSSRLRPMPESALIVRVPEAEPHVAHLRERHDPAAQLGVPAHITLLFPFLSPERITAAVLGEIRAIASATAAFSFRLSGPRHFPGVLYLAPEPPAPFVELTEALVRRFPEFPPYGGQISSILP